jgi:predicted metalloendopeptidase
VATLRVFLQASSSFSEGSDVATFARNVAQMCHRIFFHVSRHFDGLNGRKSMAKPRTERSLLFPSKEFREEVRKASKDRGFRSEQAFILAACEREIRRGDNAEAVTQFEARVAATLTNLAKQGQSLHTLAQAQVALTDVLLKYVITCVVEPPDDALPAARVRARLRYEKLVRAAAKEISNKNRDTLREMLADE